jgi:SAM-dependent methyltransferase
MYVCPDCKSPLERLYCRTCGAQYPQVDGIPILLSRSPAFERAASFAADYDSIYGNASNVWESQGKTPQFIRYFSSLLTRFRPRRFLEIGCGEGFLLASVTAGEKFAVDLSTVAMKRARTKTQAQFSVAVAERLPFPTGYFDLIASAGVMEHFLDIDEAMREIRRVMTPEGHHVAFTHVDLTLGDRLALWSSKYVFPRPQPIAVGRWLGGKVKRLLEPAPVPDFPKQPVQHRYTTRRAKARFQDNGFSVVDIIHTRKYPNLPLHAPYAVIYVACRSDADQSLGQVPGTRAEKSSWRGRVSAPEG